MKTKLKVVKVTKRAVGSVRKAGKLATKRLLAATDAALVAQGKAARARQRKRAAKAALKKVAKVLAIAGTAAATVIAARTTARGTPRRQEF